MNPKIQPTDLLMQIVLFAEFYELYRMRRLLILTCLLIAGQSVTSFGQEHYHKLDYYMYLFAKNIDWPDSVMDEYFYIGVLGETDANKNLQDLADHQKMKYLPIKIKTFANPEEISFCHLLFLPDALSESMPKVLKHMSLNTLLVTETPGKAVLGSGINISWINKYENINYEINKAAFRKAGLRISSQLTSSSAF